MRFKKIKCKRIHRIENRDYFTNQLNSQNKYFFLTNPSFKLKKLKKQTLKEIDFSLLVPHTKFRDNLA